MAENGRELVLDMLLVIEQGKEYSHNVVRSVLDKYNYLDSREKAFIKRLTEGTLERQLELDYYLNHFSKIPVKKMRPLIRCLLRMSVYQLLYMDAVPDSAVCDESCKLAAKRGFRNLKGFVNGILRTVSKRKEELPLPDREKEPALFLSVRYSVPEWLAELWMGEYGREITETLLDGLMKIHPVSLRFSSRLSGQERENWCSRIREEGALLTPGPYLPGIYLLEHAPGVGALPGFREGIFTVQDVSSALAVEAAGIKEGDFVIDVCAAPGGKSLYAGEKVGAGRLLARDISEEKRILLAENVSRMGMEDVIRTEVYDAVRTDESLLEQADAVLLDVPCSGLGVMGKKRDIKYHVTEEGIKELTALQKRIVSASAGYVKPGGTLVYSTCTIHEEENQAMVRYIVRELGFRPESLEGTLGKELLEEKRKLEEDMRRAGKDPLRGLSREEELCCIQLLPGYMKADGFFLAKFRRKASGDASGEETAPHGRERTAADQQA